VFCTCKIMLNVPKTRQLIKIQAKYLMGQASEACCPNIVVVIYIYIYIYTHTHTMEIVVNYKWKVVE
jgi:hypothetical protein